MPEKFSWREALLYGVGTAPMLEEMTAFRADERAMWIGTGCSYSESIGSKNDVGAYVLRWERIVKGISIGSNRV